MDRNRWRVAAGLSLVAVFAVISVACDQVPNRGGKRKVAKEAKHEHGEWWCDEHGVPEHECSICDKNVARECKKNGDWCDKHQRAKSQCFKCDPSLKEKYAARYRAKYGKEPPEPTD